jgi:hypothetical protein
VRKTVIAGVVTAGALGAALAVGGVAYAASGADADTDGGQQVVRVVEDDGGTGGTAGYVGNCPDKGGNSGTPSSGGDGL